MTGIIDIKLKQHSPLIHYQGNQPGAFLSAHALKAAIDHKMGNSRVGNSKKIVYSLDIRPQGQINKMYYTDLVGSNKLYFGDMGGNSPSMIVYTRGDVILRVGEYRFEANSPTGPGFYEAGFRESLKYTLAFSNFGKRGSKGFGCFWLAGDEPLEDYLKQELPRGWGLYKIPVQVQGGGYEQLMKRCFEIIDIYYKNLKSGINYPDGNNPQGSLLYAKAALMRFLDAQTPPKTWDKRHIKDRFISGGAPTGAKMFRFRLGLAQNHEYRSKRATVHEASNYRGFTVNYQTLSNGNVSDIARIPSPITFKIYCHNDRKAVILFYVNPFIRHPEYLDLQGLTIRATGNSPGAGAPLDMELAGVGDLSLNQLLDFTYRNLITGIYRAPGLDKYQGAKKVSDTLDDIRSKLVKVR